jgi:hypothetical protein
LDEDVAKVLHLEVPPATALRVHTHAFDSGALNSEELVLGVLRMFIDAGFARDFNVPPDVLCRWVLSVRKNYRDVTYHNWAHAFNVTQCMFFMLQHGRLDRFLSQAERHALMIACLSHDLDHR